MKKNIYGYCLLLLGSYLASLFYPTLLHANHAMAVDLRYDWISGNEYEVFLYFYFDCNSTIQDAPPNNPPVVISSAVCGQLFTANLQEDTNVSGDNVSQLCPTVFSSCNGGSYPGVEQYIYRRTITLPENCPDWTISYQLPTGQTRSADISNLFTPDFYRLYTEVTLNNTFAGNHSPTIGSIAVPYFCANEQVFIQNIVDPDGDSLVYSLVPPLDSPNNAIPYVGGLNSQNPLNGSLSIDAENGDISFSPLGAQRPVIAVLIEEYRNGVKIGSIRRDMQWLILNCNNEALSVNNPNLLDNTLNVCIGTPILFMLEANDIDGNNVVVTSNINTFPNSAQLIVNTASPTSGYDKQITFQWTPTIADMGDYVLQINMTDNHCPVPSTWAGSFMLHVYGAPDAGADISFCNSSNTPVTVTASNGSQFTWSPTPFSQNANGSVVQLSPPANVGDNIAYVVTNECGLSDTLYIEHHPTFSANISPASPAICANNSGTVLYAEPSGSNYSYYWQPEASVNVATDAVIYATPQQATVYTVQITDNTTACVATASTTVSFSDFTGTVMATAAADTVCVGETVQLNSTAVYLPQLTCGISNNNCDGIDTLITLGTHTDSSFNFTPYNGFWENGRLLFMYTAAELQAMGNINDGLIKEIGFYITRKFSTAPLSQFYIKMGCTEIDHITNFIDGLTEVYATTNLVTTAQTWNMYTLDTPFAWDGSSNIVIEICHHNTDANQFDEVAASTSSYSSAIKAQTSIGNNPCSITNNALINNLRPDMRFLVCMPDANTNNTQITWLPAEGLSNPNIANPIATPTTTTTYTAIYENGGCSGSSNVTVVVPQAALEQLHIVADSLLCANELPRTLPLSIAETLPNNAQLLWQSLDILDNANSPSPTLLCTQAQTITVSAQLNDACNTMLYDSLQLQLVAPPSLMLTPNEATINEGENITLTATGNFSSLQWQSDHPIDNPTALSIIVSPQENTSYIAIAQDANACETRDTVQINVIPFVPTQCYTLPNAFSPNNDGINDELRANVYTPNSFVSLQIYNRFGEEVFSTHDANAATWDGTYKGLTQPVGVYAFYLTMICDDSPQTVKGNVTLIR